MVIFKINHVLISCLLIGFIFTLLTFLYTGYSFGTNNHIEQLPLIMREINEDYISRDPFVNDATQYGPRFYFTKLIASFGKYFPLIYLFFIFNFIFRYLLFILTFYIIFDLFKGNLLVSFLGSLSIVSWQVLEMGNAGMLISPELVPSVIAYPALLFAWWKIYNNNLRLALPPLLFGLLIHPGLGVQITVLAIISKIVLLIFERKLQKSYKSLFIFSLFVIGFILAFWVIPINSGLEKDSYIYILAKFRHPHHYYPSYFSKNHINSLIFFVISMFYSLYFIYKGRYIRASFFRYLVISVLIALIFMVVGFVFVEYYPVRLIVTLQMFRYVGLIQWLGLISITAFVGLTLQELFSPSISLKGVRSHLVPVFVQVFIAIQLFYLGIYKILSATEKILGLYIFLIAVLLVWKSINNVFKSLVVILLLSYALTNFDHIDRILFPNKLNINMHSPGKLQLDISTFARENTINSSLFLTPPDFGFFRLTAERAILSDFKAFPLNESAMLRWYERLLFAYGKSDKIGFAVLPELNENYNNINDKRISVIQETFNIDYVVLPSSVLTSYKVLYSNEKYILIEL